VLRRVQERPDGTNVNNWHWTERDVMGWSRGRLGELLGGTALAGTAEATAKVTGVQELEGACGDRAQGLSKGSRDAAQTYCGELQRTKAKPRAH